MSFPLPEWITIWNAITNDGHGGSTWSAPTVAPARIAFKLDKITDQNGDDYVSKAVFYSRAVELVTGSRVYFGTSAALKPPKEADDAVMVTNTPSGATTLKKGWI